MLPDFIRDSELYGPLFALGVLAVLQVVALAVNLALKVVARRREQRQPGGLAAQMLGIVRGPAVLLLVVLGFFLTFLVLSELTIPALDFISSWEPWMGKVWLVSIILLITYAISKLVDALITWYAHNLAARTETDLDDRLVQPVKRVIPFVLYLIGLMVALDSIGISISPLLAGLGVAGLAVALAIQPTLNNFLSGTYIVAEGVMEQGDFVEMEGGPSGFVVDIGWRSTKLRSMMNNIVTIPNSKLVDSVITNLNAPTPAMNIIVYCGVSYDSDLAAVERIAMEASSDVVNASDCAVKSVEPFIGFEEFGDSNITFWVFVQAIDRTGSFVLTGELVKGLHARFLEEGIEINYPVRKLVYPAANGNAPNFRPPATGAANPDGDGGNTR